MDSAYIPIIAGISIGIFLIATATPKEQPKKVEPKKEKNASKGKGKAKEVKPKFTAEEEERHFGEILKQLDSGSNVDYTALVKKIDDAEGDLIFLDKPLDPEVPHSHMPHLAVAFPACNSDGRG